MRISRLSFIRNFVDDIIVGIFERKNPLAEPSHISKWMI